jgi:hypothetical protein
MSVLIDAPVWSLALRRKAAQLNREERLLVEEWKSLVWGGRARLAGIIRQEVLSGIRDARDFERLRERLAVFDDVPAGASDYECVASYFNVCRAKGISGTSTCSSARSLCATNWPSLRQTRTSSATRGSFPSSCIRSVLPGSSARAVRD